RPKTSRRVHAGTACTDQPDRCHRSPLALSVAPLGRRSPRPWGREFSDRVRAPSPPTPPNDRRLPSAESPPCRRPSSRARDQLILRVTYRAKDAPARLQSRSGPGAFDSWWLQVPAVRVVRARTGSRVLLPRAFFPQIGRLDSRWPPSLQAKLDLRPDVPG